jgi:hypothetical protein
MNTPKTWQEKYDRALQDDADTSWLAHRLRALPPQERVSVNTSQGSEIHVSAHVLAAALEAYRPVLLGILADCNLEDAT